MRHPTRGGSGRTPTPIVIPAEKPLAGFVASEYVRPNSECLIEIRGIHTFDEGLTFYNVLDGLNSYLQKAACPPSQVDRMLLIVLRDKTFMYLNDNLPLTWDVRVKRQLNAGERVFRNDIAGIRQVNFPGIEVPEQSGFLLLLSAGWRRGVCFDLQALEPVTAVNSQEVFAGFKQMAGLLLTHLWFTGKFLLESTDWDEVIEAGWFPFIFLADDLWEGLFKAVKYDGDLQAEEQRVYEAFLESCEERLSNRSLNRRCADHMDFLRSAVEAYKRNE